MAETGHKLTNPNGCIGREVITEENEQGCQLVVSHRLNQDGYFRKHVDGKLKMYHRHVYEQHKGSIPNGYEVDHLCRNRSCINPEHLQILTREEHLVKTNQERYSDRQQKAKEYWLTHDISGTYLAEMFGVSFGTGCKWVRKWKAEVTNAQR